MRHMPQIYIASLSEAGYLSAIREGFERLGVGARLKPGDRVCIKPNLTFPTFRPGVMTNPECLENLIIALRDYTERLTIVESDAGGYNRFRMDDVFEKIGLNVLGKRYGVGVVNLSNQPARNIAVASRGRQLQVPLPCMLLDDCDFFITVPVPKVHCNTLVSLAVKNQWGCIAQPIARLELHPDFPQVIYQVNKALRIALVVVDGRYGLNRNGPMRGDAVELNWLMVTDDIYAADVVCCWIMQIEPRKAPHLRYLEETCGLPSEQEILFNQDYKKFSTHRFYLRREWTDYPGLVAFRSRVAAYWAYRSPLAGFLHRMLYLVRQPFY